VLPSAGAGASDAIRRVIAQARSAGDHDLVIVDGPAMPWSPEDRRLLEMADGLTAILPASLDINGCMDDIIASLGGAERKLIGVIINELHTSGSMSHRSKQYA
jgi:methylmalonyl-CoA mutase cobalamin-binding subunit